MSATPSILKAHIGAPFHGTLRKLNRGGGENHAVKFSQCLCVLETAPRTANHNPAHAAAIPHWGSRSMGRARFCAWTFRKDE